MVYEYDLQQIGLLQEFQSVFLSQIFQVKATQEA